VLLNGDISTNLVHNKRVLSMKFDISVYIASTDCGVERKCLWCVCVCVCVCVCRVGGGGSFKVSKSKTRMEVGV